MQVKEFMQTNQQFETCMANALDAITQDYLKEVMQYSLMNGGKRVRPYLLLATLQAVGSECELGYDVAVALECVHTYSLIHDDLPAMDNDDYRRGKLTSHKQFDEASAILAGDALLTIAFEKIAQASVSAEQKVRLIKELAVSAGANGMIGGQMRDILAEEQQVDLEALKTIHALKTGELIRYAVFAACVIGECSTVVQDHLESFAKSFGLAFQIHNDLKDVEQTFEQEGKIQGRDAQLEKSTYTALLGVSGARQALQEEVEKAIQAVQRAKDMMPQLDDMLLKSFLEYLR